MHKLCLSLAAIFTLNAAALADSFSIQAAYPKAAAVLEWANACPLLADALDPDFFDALDQDNNSAFLQTLSDKLGRQAYRKIGPVAAIRVQIQPGHILEAPYIILEYQTQFTGIINIGGGAFGGNCVLIPGGRDAFAHRTFFGITEDETARKKYLEMYQQRQAMPSNRRNTMTGEFDRLFNGSMPDASIQTVQSDIKTKLQQMVTAFEPYGARMLKQPHMGQIGAKITDHLYLYIREFPKGSPGSKVEVTDPYFWLILSGGPKPMPKDYLPAFPGAEGLGAMTTGGRGGKVIYVTNTNTDGPGSFAEAVNTKGARVVLFKVSGQITLPQDVWITEPDMTLIGYNAPGEGIEICGRICMAASNIIMRGMRWRLRPPLAADGMDTNGDLRNLIFDHCSFAYGSDEILRFIGQGHTFWGYTFQYCNIGPGMSGLGSHPYGPEIGGVGSIHHCILHNTLSRSPEVDCSRIDWRNNIFYNCRSGHSKRLTNQFNLVNNLVIDNPDMPFTYEFSATENNFAAGNYHEVKGKKKVFDPVPSDTYVKAPFEFMPVTTYPAEQFEQHLLPVIGAYLPVRDATDGIWIERIKARTAKPAFWVKSASDWESYNPGSNDRKSFDMWLSEDFPPPAAGAVAAEDSDNDGMPDEYEKANGFDPKDASDGSLDSDQDGYSNVEECLYRTNPNQYVDYRNPANNLHTLH
ncbi:MAG: hypothetical protein LLF76_07495 [Planctomycetaceae bacterium]|nr:hypothetical protein [Planctomycetaceae bacterium]